MAAQWQIEAQVVDVVAGRVFPARVRIRGGQIEAVEYVAGGSTDRTLIPGFVDSHVHIESSLLSPARFSQLATGHGTVGVMADPHEIANVLGMDGVDFMIADASRVPLKASFAAPSCVPASPFETSGAALSAADVKRLLERPEVRALGEMMNVPGVLSGDADLASKLEAAHSLGLPVDGHAPGLGGDALRRYVGAGISTDHECTSLDEGREKIAAGAYVLIREGSAARDFEVLLPLLREAPERVMFCTDDLHPDSLVRGHIDVLARRAVDAGYDVLDVLRAASLNPVRHYGLPLGLLQAGDPADFVIVDDLATLTVLETVIDGRCVWREGQPLFDVPGGARPNRFEPVLRRVEEFAVRGRDGQMRVIEVRDRQLVTGASLEPASCRDGYAVSDPSRDLLKIAVVNRYTAAPVAVGFVKNVGLQEGAVASSIAHDAHNIVAVGVRDCDICRAVNRVVEHRGALVVVWGEDDEVVLPLPIAGLMSDSDGARVARMYAGAEAAARRLGSSLSAPLMTLSFLSLSVIPELKLTDLGLFDGRSFEHVPLFVS